MTDPTPATRAEAKEQARELLTLPMRRVGYVAAALLGIAGLVADPFAPDLGAALKNASAYGIVVIGGVALMHPTR